MVLLALRMLPCTTPSAPEETGSANRDDVLHDCSQAGQLAFDDPPDRNAQVFARGVRVLVASEISRVEGVFAATPMAGSLVDRDWGGEALEVELRERS
jgi:hypothetical protein